jgi:twinkle protein
MSRYSDGHGFCFSCNAYEPGDGETLAPTKERGEFRYEGEFAALHKRRISEATCRKFNVRVVPGGVRFPYTNSAGVVVGYKERDADKNFRWTGKNEDKLLFGQNLFGSGKRLVITEGEMDAMSVWEAFPSWPVVSIPSGAKGAKKAIQQQLTWALGFDDVVLFFDGDEPGLEAAQECAKLFPPEKVRIATMGTFKDASEALQSGDRDIIRQAIWNAKSYTPRSIIDGRDLLEVLSRPLDRRDAEWPWAALNDITDGLRLGELVTVTAGSGVGKSTMTGEAAQALVKQGFPVGYIALEESVQRTGLRLMTVEANKPLHLNNAMDPVEFKRAFDASVGSGRVFLRDGFGSVDPDEILNDIRFLTLSKGVKFCILDHLSILLSGNATDDERKLIDVTMTKLRSFVEETRIGLILISHLSRVSGDKGHEDGAQVSLRHLRGSHSIVQLSDIVIALERNLSAGDDHSHLRVLKNRFNGKTGPAGNLVYDRNTGRMTEETLTPGVSFDDF